MQMARQLEPLCGKISLLHIWINIITKGEHVLEIECLNRIIKYRVCATYKNIKHHLTNISGVLIR